MSPTSPAIWQKNCSIKCNLMSAVPLWSVQTMYHAQNRILSRCIWP
ncbi:hypothetical protein MGSAQ_001588 [marine sediment metagenome]|uniref:Uncharacterized protein n=1 Tax=marine sediment metagenome TaxID=412755 RepID=A0A1B6NTW7_9ZZZZ